MLAAFADQIAQWPNILVVFTFAGTMLALVFAAHALGERLLPKGEREALSHAALDTLKVLGPLTGLFLSFSLVQSITQFRAADMNVIREAADISQLDRALAGAPLPEESRAARLALRDYVHHVATDEWAGLRAGTLDVPQAADALARLQQAVEALVARLPPEQRTFNDVDKNFDDVQDDRAGRLAVAHGGLPDVMWWVLALLFALTFACTGCLQGAMARHPLPMLYITGLGLLAALLFIMDRPFQGEPSISPAPLLKVQGQLDARLKGERPPPVTPPAR